MKLYAYKQGSQSAKALSEALGIKRVKHEGPRLDMRGATLINWGASRVVRTIVNATILNTPDAVSKASNKLNAFLDMSLHEVPCPDWTTDKKQAIDWTIEGHHVVARLKLNGHSGEGIEIVNVNDPMPDAPLYTKYVKKKEEYRIHVFQGEVIFQQRKARKKDVPDDQVNWKVRNLAGGFIFANVDIVAPEDVLRASISAVDSLGLDFGAIDCILGTDGKAYALEVNTACGLEGSTIDAYVKAFKKYL